MITSGHLKAALMAHYRFKKNYIVADEVGMQIGNADILVDTGKLLIEIETKISRSDLFQGEKRKGQKHHYMKIVTEELLMKRNLPNQFYIAVPTELVNDAIEWINQINPKYGVLECRTIVLLADRISQKDFEDCVKIIKKATNLHDKPIIAKSKQLIGKRLSSAMAANHMSGIIGYNKRKKENTNG